MTTKTITVIESRNVSTLSGKSVSAGVSINSSTLADNSVYAKVGASNIFSKDNTFNGTLTINGDIIQNGSTYQTQVEQVIIKNNINYINSGQIGDGVSGKIGIGDYAVSFAGWGVDRGDLSTFFWGFNEDSDAFVVGKLGSLQSVATREDNPSDGGIMIWDSSKKTLVSTKIIEPVIAFEKLINAQDINFRQTNTGIVGGDNLVGRASGFEGWRIQNTGLVHFANGIEVAGNIATETYFRSTTSNAVLGTNSIGNVLIRPYAWDNSRYQSTFSTEKAHLGTKLEVSSSITYGTTLYSPASGGIEFNNFGNIKFKSDATTTNYFHIDSVDGSFLARYYNYGRVEQYYGGKLRTATTSNGFDISGRVGSPNYVSGLTGADWRITKSGFADLDEVNIRKGLTVHELIVARERSVNGGIITSVANGTVKSVVGNVITLKGQYNSWVVGDRVRLQQWEASTRYMEAEVIAVNGMTITLGNYSNTTRPQANEDLVQWGHVSDISRQNFLYQTARGTNAAYFAVMHGVNSSSLTDKQVLRIGNLGGYANAGYGIASKYEGKTYFELSNNVKTIAGIAFDSEKLTAGNVRIWNNGDIINTATGTPYALYNDGSGILAKGNISWDTSGNVTFGSNVSLNWNGGANLFKNSRCIVNGKLANIATNGSTLSVDTTIKYQGEPTMKVIGSTGGFKWLTYTVIEPDTIYTVSMMVRSVVNFAGSTTTPVHIQVPAGGHTYENIISHNMSLVANEWKQIHLTFSSTATTAQDMQMYLYTIPKTQVNVAWIKLEKGTGASDWNEPVDVNKLTKITGSGIYTGTLTTAQIIATGIKVGTGGIQLDSSAVISWSNVTGTQGVETTAGAQLKADVAEASATAVAGTAQDRADSAHLLAESKTDSWVTAITHNTVTSEYMRTLNLVVGDQISMGANAVISWDNVTGTSGIETTTGSQAKANAAKSSAISSASTDATSKSNSAKTSAISTASSDATAKANAAKSSAISTASTDATSKANSAIAISATDATNKSNDAKNAAISVANTAQSKANSAYSLANTKITSSQATTITKSTVTAAYINAFSLTSVKGTIGGLTISHNSLYVSDTTSGGIKLEPGQLRSYRTTIYGAVTGKNSNYGVQNHGVVGVLGGGTEYSSLVGCGVLALANNTVGDGKQYALAAIATTSHAKSAYFKGDVDISGDMGLSGNIDLKGRIVHKVYGNLGSTRSAYPTSINVSTQSTLLLGSSASGRYYKFTGAVQGQILYIINRNDSSDVHIRGFLEDSGSSTSYYTLGGGCSLTAMYITSTFYNATRTGGWWVILGKYDQNW